MKRSGPRERANAPRALANPNMNGVDTMKNRTSTKKTITKTTPSADAAQPIAARASYPAAAVGSALDEMRNLEDELVVLQMAVSHVMERVVEEDAADAVKMTLNRITARLHDARAALQGAA